MEGVCMWVWEMPDTFTIFCFQKQEREQEHKRNKRQVRLLLPGIMKTYHLTKQMRLSTAENESWPSPQCSSKFLLKCMLSYTSQPTKLFPESTVSSFLREVKISKTNPGNLLCTRTGRKGLLVCLVKKFLAAYPNVLSLIDKATNTEKDKKKKRKCITYSPVRSLLWVPIKHLCRISGYCIFSNKDQEGMRVKKKIKQQIVHFCNIIWNHRTSSMVSHSPLMSYSLLKKDWVCW